MKNNLYISATWDKKDIEESWSGTAYFIMSYFSKHKNVTKINYPGNRIYDMIIRRIYKTGSSVLLSSYYKILELIFDRQIDEKIEAPILMISGVLNSKAKFITYQDNIINSYIMFDELEKNQTWFYKGILPKMSASQKKKAMQYEYEVYQRAEAILYMGEWLCQYAKEIFPDLAHKMYAIGGGINIPKAKFSEDKRQGNKILFVGRDFYRKGGDLLIEAFKIVREKYDPGVELYIAGPKELPSCADGVENLVFKGDVSYDQVGDLMAECDLFCMPSRFEAYGLVFIEALASGLPCIARNAFEMPYFIEKGVTGELIDIDDPEELALKIYNVLNDENFKINVKNKHDYYIDKYNWENVISKILKITG